MAYTARFPPPQQHFAILFHVSSAPRVLILTQFLKQCLSSSEHRITGTSDQCLSSLLLQEGWCCGRRRACDATADDSEFCFGCQCTCTLWSTTCKRSRPSGHPSSRHRCSILPTCHAHPTFIPHFPNSIIIDRPRMHAILQLAVPCGHHRKHDHAQ